MLKKDGFQWGTAQTQAFQQLKRAMTTCPVLALPDFTVPFTIEADACAKGLGAVLMQKGRPIAFLSKSLGPKSAAQSIYEKEAMAILEALKKWRHYVWGNKLIIKTDQHSLKYMTTQRLTEGVQHKLLLKLLEYDYTIEYKKGKENVVADALSRRDTLHSIHSQNTTIIIPEWTEDVLQSYQGDKDSDKLLKKVAVDTEETPKFSTHNGLLKYKNIIYVGASTEFRKQLLQTFHSSALGGHSGSKATYYRIKKVFYWPNMKKQIEEFVSQCPVCQLNKVEHIHPPGLLQPLPIPDMA